MPALVRAESPEPAADLETPDVDLEPAPGRKVRALASAPLGGQQMFQHQGQGAGTTGCGELGCQCCGPLLQTGDFIAEPRASVARERRGALLGH